MKIGILTFYCSDNYGAMLQAYGLKNFVKKFNTDVEIVPYAPFYLVGRHWFIPYYPFKSKKERFIWTLTGIKHNLQMKGDFIRQKSNMNRFRKQYLIEDKRRIRSIKGLETLDFDVYIVGSDQIWNPEITFGLRKAYFGAFNNSCKHKVISYAASMGGSKLSQTYDAEMRNLLQFIDSISVREKSAVAYIQSLCNKEVSVTADPVFLLNSDQWEKIEVRPKISRYILVYDTERNSKLNLFVKNLSKKKKLKVVEIKLRKAHDDPDFYIDASAGPAEFLGYIHHAEYVVTNSFHATAFSIIFHKSFLVFGHSNYNARLENVLLQCGLDNRIISVKNNIDESIDWECVEQKKEKMIQSSKEFLRKNLFD